MKWMPARNYFSNWKEELRRVMGGFKWFPYVYAVFICPLMMSPIGLDDVWFCVEMGAFMLCIIFMRMFPLRLPGTMFFCPLDGGQRVEYLQKGCRMKIWICTGVCAAGGLVSLAGWRVPLGAVAVVFAFEAALMPVLVLYMEEPYWYGRYDTWVKTNLTGYTFCMSFSGAAGVLNVLIWLVWGVTGEIWEFTAFGWTILSLLALVQLAVSAVVLLHYRKRVLRAAADYEDTYMVWEKN